MRLGLQSGRFPARGRGRARLALPCRPVWGGCYAPVELSTGYAGLYPFNSQRLQALEQTFFLNKNLQNSLSLKNLPLWAHSLPPEVTSVTTPLEDIIKIGNYPPLSFTSVLMFSFL